MSRFSNLLSFRSAQNWLQRAALSLPILIGGTSVALAQQGLAPRAAFPLNFEEVKHGNFYAQIDRQSREVMYAIYGRPGEAGAYAYAGRLGKIIIYRGTPEQVRTNAVLLEQNLRSLRVRAPILNGLPRSYEPASLPSSLSPQTVEQEGRIPPLTVNTKPLTESPRRLHVVTELPAPPAPLPPPPVKRVLPNSREGNIALRPQTLPSTLAAELQTARARIEAAELAKNEAQSRAVAAEQRLTTVQATLEARVAQARTEAREAMRTEVLAAQRSAVPQLQELLPGAPRPEQLEPLALAYEAGQNSEARKARANLWQAGGAGALLTGLAMSLAGMLLLRRERAKARLDKRALLRQPIILTDNRHYPFVHGGTPATSAEMIPAVKKFLQSNGYKKARITASEDNQNLIIELSPDAYLLMTSQSIILRGRKSQNDVKLMLQLGKAEITGVKTSWDKIAVQEVEHPFEHRSEQGKDDSKAAAQPRDLHHIYRARDELGLGEQVKIYVPEHEPAVAARPVAANESNPAHHTAAPAAA